MPRPICLKLERQVDMRACSRAWANTGKRIAAKMAMMAITTSNSIRVKPSRFLMVCLLSWEKDSRIARALSFLMTAAGRVFRSGSLAVPRGMPRLLHFRLHLGVPRQQLAGAGNIRETVLRPGPLLIIVAGPQGLTEPGGLGVAIEEEGLHLVVRVDEETTSILPSIGEAPDPIVRVGGVRLDQHEVTRRLRD